MASASTKLRTSAFSRLPDFLRALYRVLCTAWVGTLWAIGYVAVPILFAALDDRVMAGALAGRMFTVGAWLGIACAVVLWVLARRGTPGRGRTLRLWLIAGMLGLVALGAFVLQPAMAQLKAGGLAAGSVEAAEFARLHGVSSLLYLAVSIGGLVLAALGSPQRRQPG